MDTRFEGPHVIVQCLTKGFYKLRSDDNVIERVSGAHLKPYNDPSGNEFCTGSESDISQMQTSTGSSLSLLNDCDENDCDENDCDDVAKVSYNSYIHFYSAYMYLINCRNGFQSLNFATVTKIFYVPQVHG